VNAREYRTDSQGKQYVPGQLYEDLKSVIAIRAEFARQEVWEVPPNRLLAEAEAAGLSVRVEGEKLVVRGPRKAEELVRVILRRKAEVMAWLASSARDRPCSTAVAQDQLPSPPEAADERQLLVLMPNGDIKNIGSLAALPEEATHWCRLGDVSWIPVEREP
jgi:hypothetical protein